MEETTHLTPNQKESTMTFPSFTAERSLYRSSRHYRASALPSLVGGVRQDTYLFAAPFCLGRV